MTQKNIEYYFMECNMSIEQIADKTGLSVETIKALLIKPAVYIPEYQGRNRRAFQDHVKPFWIDTIMRKMLTKLFARYTVVGFGFKKKHYTFTRAEALEWMACYDHAIMYKGRVFCSERRTLKAWMFREGLLFLHNSPLQSSRKQKY